MCARRFLFLIFFLTLIVVAGAFAIFQFGGGMLARTAAPSGHYVTPPPAAGPDYALDSSWLARPTMGDAQNPALWRPTEVPPPPLEASKAATFYIHPTTYLERDRWNAALDPGGDAGFRARLFVQSQRPSASKRSARRSAMSFGKSSRTFEAKREADWTSA